MMWRYRPSTPSDAAWIATLRADVLHADLQRLGRYDPIRVRERFLAAFQPENTRVIVWEGQDAGTIAVREERESRWIEHFYLRPEVQGRGIGGEVLANILTQEPGDVVHRLNVLQGSAATRLYLRHGFVVEKQDAVDVFMIR